MSDADVRAAPDLLINLVARFHHESAGLVACLYRVADPVGLAQQCEAAAVNSDFWTGVLQARRLGGLRPFPPVKDGTRHEHRAQRA